MFYSVGQRGHGNFELVVTAKSSVENKLLLPSWLQLLNSKMNNMKSSREKRTTQKTVLLLVNHPPCCWVYVFNIYFHINSGLQLKDEWSS